MGFYIYLHILVYNEGISVITFFIITFINLTLGNYFFYNNIY